MKRGAGVAIALAVWAFPPLGQAIDLEPGDVAVPAANIKMLQATHLQRRFGDLYQRGTRQSVNSQLHRSELQIRYGQAFAVADKRAFFYAQLPTGTLRPQKDLKALQTQNSSGLGDMAMLLAIWPYANYQTQTFFGIGGYLILPTGSYDADKPFNLGGNRTLSAVQLGFQTPLAKQLHWQSALDVLFYGKNSEFGASKQRLEQRPFYSAQTSLQFFITPQTAASISYFYSEGGERRVNRGPWNNRLEVHRYKLALQHQIGTHRLTLQIGEDLKTHNGFKEEWQAAVRYSYFFQ